MGLDRLMTNNANATERIKHKGVGVKRLLDLRILRSALRAGQSHVTEISCTSTLEYGGRTP